MTNDKQFKKAVRQHMAETGESYSTARMHVLAQTEEGQTVLGTVQRRKMADGLKGATPSSSGNSPERV